MLHLTLECAERWKFEEKLRDISFFYIFALEEIIIIKGSPKVMESSFSLHLDALLLTL